MKFVNPYAAFALYGMRNFQVSDIKRKYNDKEYIMSRSITSALAFLVCIIVSIILILMFTNKVEEYLYLMIPLVGCAIATGVSCFF